MEALLFRKRINLVSSATKLFEQVSTMHAAELHTCVQALQDAHTEFPVKIQCALVKRRVAESMEKGGNDLVEHCLPAWRPWGIEDFDEATDEFDGLRPTMFSICCALMDKEQQVSQELASMDPADGDAEEAKKIKELQDVGQQFMMDWQVVRNNGNGFPFLCGVVGFALTLLDHVEV